MALHSTVGPDYSPLSLPFTRHSEMLVENRDFFVAHLHSTPPSRGTPSDFRKNILYGKHSGVALNNNIIIIIISKTMFMVLSSRQSHCESSPGSFDECRTASSGRRPKTKPDDLGCESACTSCQSLHPPSPFIITQPES